MRAAGWMRLDDVLRDEAWLALGNEPIRPADLRRKTPALLELARREELSHQRDRRNLTPDQLALVMGRHYNIVKGKRGENLHPIGKSCPSGEGHKDQILGKEYGVNHKTIRNAGKFAAAVETLKAIDPEIEQKVVTGKGPGGAA